MFAFDRAVIARIWKLIKSERVKGSLRATQRNEFLISSLNYSACTNFLMKGCNTRWWRGREKLTQLPCELFVSWSGEQNGITGNVRRDSIFLQNICEKKPGATLPQKILATVATLTSNHRKFISKSFKRNEGNFHLCIKYQNNFTFERYNYSPNIQLIFFLYSLYLYSQKLNHNEWMIHEFITIKDRWTLRLHNRKTACTRIGLRPGMCIKVHEGLNGDLGDPTSWYIGLRANTRAR